MEEQRPPGFSQVPGYMAGIGGSWTKIADTRVWEGHFDPTPRDYSFNDYGGAELATTWEEWSGKEEEGDSWDEDDDPLSNPRGSGERNVAASMMTLGSFSNGTKRAPAPTWPLTHHNQPW